MTKQDKTVLINGLKKLSADMADLAAQLEGLEAKQQDSPSVETAYTMSRFGRFWQRSPGLGSEQRSKRFSPRMV